MRKEIIVAVLTFVALSLNVWAANKGPVELMSISEVEITVKNEKGEKEVKRVEAAKANVVPGDVVIFTTYYSNKGKEPASDIVINNPMPEHMLYIDGTAEGNGTKIEFSVDKGKRFGPPETLKVKDDKGKERPASPSDYTHIRWIMSKPLTPGGKGSVSFRAKVK